jgi:hypothetical protein
LNHYTAALTANLEAAEVGATQVEVDLEIGGVGHIGKVRLLLAAAGPMLKLARSGGPVVVVWPIFGLLDVLFWRVLAPRGARRLVIVHDPLPLRRQFGYSRRASRLGAWATRDPRIEVVAHTELAAQELAKRGLAVRHVLPHPVIRAKATDRVASVSVLVAGQYKESRDLAILERLGRAPHDPWELHIVGRGWPAIEGWDVDSRFVTEDELDLKLASAAAVLIPYSHYFQSGIATRCCELSIPVVAHRHEFIESLYGSDWPGFVETETEAGWLGAVARVVGLGVSSERAVASSALAWGRVLRPVPQERNPWLPN